MAGDPTGLASIFATNRNAASLTSTETEHHFLDRRYSSDAFGCLEKLFRNAGVGRVDELLQHPSRLVQPIPHKLYPRNNEARFDKRFRSSALWRVTGRYHRCFGGLSWPISRVSRS